MSSPYLATQGGQLGEKNAERVSTTHTPLKLLVVKLSSLGDVVHTLTALMDMRAQFPSAQIDWVVEKSFAPLLKICPGVDKVIESDIREWRGSWWTNKMWSQFADFKKILRENSYDAIIDLQGLSKSALISKLAKLNVGGKRYAMGNQTNGASYEFLTKWVADVSIKIKPQVHAVERARILCANALGYSYPIQQKVSAGLSRLALVVSPAPSVLPNTVVLVHASSRADKTWPLKNWTELGQALMKQGFNIALPQGSEKELEQARKIANTLPGAVVWIKMNLKDLAAHLRACSGVIGVDSGLSHIAEALDLPLVQIYNFDTNWRTGPQRLSHQASIFESPTPSVQSVIGLWEKCWHSLQEIQNPTSKVLTDTLSGAEINNAANEEAKNDSAFDTSLNSSFPIELQDPPTALALGEDIKKSRQTQLKSSRLRSDASKKPKVTKLSNKAKEELNPQPGLFD